MSILLVSVDTFFTRVMASVTKSNYDMLAIITNGKVELIDLYSCLVVKSVESREDLIDCSVVKSITSFSSNDKVDIDTSVDRLSDTLTFRRITSNSIITNLLTKVGITITKIEIISTNADTIGVQTYFDRRFTEMLKLTANIINIELFDKMFREGYSKSEVHSSKSNNTVKLSSRQVTVIVPLDGSDLSALPDTELKDIVTFINSLTDSVERSNLLSLSRTAMRELGKRRVRN